MIVSASLGDYLYIIIGIVWLAFSVYKGQKKKSASSDSAQKSSGRSFIDNLIAEFNPEPTVNPVPYIVDDYADINTETAEVEEPTFFSYDDEVEESNVNDTSVVYRKRDFNSEKVTQLKDNNVIDKQRYTKKRNFDLRKAVIYSEVLNPRYF